MFYLCWFHSFSKSVTLSWRKTDFGQSIWPASDQQTTAFTILNCLEYEFLKVFWSKSDSCHFENSPSFQISWTYSDVFQINEKFINKCPPCLLAEMAKVETKFRICPHFHTFVCNSFTFLNVSQSKLAWWTPDLGILWISVCSFWLLDQELFIP